MNTTIKSLTSSRDLQEASLATDARPAPIRPEEVDTIVRAWTSIFGAPPRITPEDQNPYDSDWPPGLCVSGITLRPALIQGPGTGHNGFELEVVHVVHGYPHSPDDADPEVIAVLPTFWQAVGALLQTEAERRISDVLEGIGAWDPREEDPLPGEFLTGCPSCGSDGGRHGADCDLVEMRDTPTPTEPANHLPCWSVLRDDRFVGVLVQALDRALVDGCRDSDGREADEGGGRPTVDSDNDTDGDLPEVARATTRTGKRIPPGHDIAVVTRWGPIRAIYKTRAGAERACRNGQHAIRGQICSGCRIVRVYWPPDCNGHDALPPDCLPGREVARAFSNRAPR